MCRQTAHQWLREPQFQAALNAVRNDMRRELEVQPEVLAIDAIGVVRKRVSEGDERMSLAVLKRLGLFGGASFVALWESASEIEADQWANRILSAIVSIGSHRGHEAGEPRAH